MQATAQTTASDGSTVQDCVTLYVEGPETTDTNRTDGINDGGLTGGSGIPNGTITGRLDELYTGSYSYNNLLVSDGTPTSNLMTGVAKHESPYRQFVTPIEGNPDPDLFNLWADYKIPAKWPNENVKTSDVPRGKYIGLMQVGDPFTDADAWDWTVNTQDGVNKFSGGSKRVYDDVQDAVKFEGYIRNGYSSKTVTIPAHKNADGSYISVLDAGEKENNALVLYAGDVKKCSGDVVCTTNSLYWFPQCSGTVNTNAKRNTATCSTSWQWVPNTSNQFSGLLYVSNNKNDSWYDQCSQPGVRDDLK